MSLQPLDKKLRKQLENTIIKARNVAEAAARTALERLCVGDGKPGEHLTEAMRQQRNKLRAYGRQLGDSRKDNAEQTIEHLVQETAYEQWHRMLFARFLAENSLLRYEDGVTPLSIKDCFELAEDEADVDGWELAGRYASAILPQIFRTENPVLTIRFSPEHQRELEKLLEGLEAETFQASDSLGWVYQYWQTQKKEEVNKSGNKIGADELSAVTQLFTEPYMVSFLLDNSLGARWVSHYPQYKDLLPFQYLRYAPEPVDEEHTDYKETDIPAAGTFEQWPKALSELKMLDPCCGSGHFLVATLLMLVPMRMKAEGLTADEAIARVLSENIHGLELDQRCVEIAAFAVALEAWRYPESSGYRPLPSLNIAWVGQSIKAKKEDWLSLAGDDEYFYYGMEALYNTFKDAPLLGSLIDPSKSIAKDLLSDGFSELQPLLNQALQQFEVAENQEAAIAAKGLTLAVDLLNQKYGLIATNVPYLSRGKQCELLQVFTERHYTNAKGDIANVFLERCLELNTKGGVTQMVMPQNWLFLGSYKKQREYLLKEVTWNLLARLGASLQVAVARLLGYQWPAELDKGMELSDETHHWIDQCEQLKSYVDDDGIVCLSPVRGEKSADERLEALLMAAFGEQWNASLRNKLLSEVNCKGKSLDFWLREKFFEQHCKLFQNRPFIWHIWDGLADGFSALVNFHQLNRQNLERLIYTYLGDWIRTQDHGVKEEIDGAILRLQAAQTLKTHLETILEGESPYDIFVRWKSLAEQPIGWNPDINDGVRMNIRPFMAVPDVGKKEAGILRSKPNIKWTKDRGNDVESAPWYRLGLKYGETEGSRINNHHLTLAEKQAARDV